MSRDGVRFSDWRCVGSREEALVEAFRLPSACITEVDLFITLEAVKL
jgi:hypothetical protein